MCDLTCTYVVFFWIALGPNGKRYILRIYNSTFSCNFYFQIGIMMNANGVFSNHSILTYVNNEKQIVSEAVDVYSAIWIPSKVKTLDGSERVTSYNVPVNDLTCRMHSQQQNGQNRATNKKKKRKKRYKVVLFLKKTHRIRASCLLSLSLLMQSEECSFGNKMTPEIYP